MEQKRIATVEEMVAEVRLHFKGSRTADIFERCFSNTLNTTVKHLKDGTVFVITGDIPAMWLRDSVCQLRPYLILAEHNPQIADLMEGLIKRQMDFISKDAYANAFNEAANGQGHQKDRTDMKPFVWERKYETDSLCFPIQFSYLLWKNTGRTGQFTAEWKNAVKRVIEVFRTEQDHEEKSPYTFERMNCVHTDTLSRGGKGALVKSSIGLTWSGFRPSDDSCAYGYLIPSNMFAVVVLTYVEEIAEKVYQDRSLAEEARRLAEEIHHAIRTYAILRHEKYGEVYAYEADGFGEYNIMDDANVPSLLAAPYLGYCSREDAVYQNTRRMVLSDTNPYYYKGKYAQGIGSPHTPENYIWHISLAVQGLTAKDREEKEACIKLLTETDGGTGMMHEGFYAEDPNQYTREWFSWANAMFCELVLDYCGYRVKR